MLRLFVAYLIRWFCVLYVCCLTGLLAELIVSLSFWVLCDFRFFEFVVGFA